MSIVATILRNLKCDGCGISGLPRYLPAREVRKEDARCGWITTKNPVDRKLKDYCPECAKKGHGTKTVR